MFGQIFAKLDDIIHIPYFLKIARTNARQILSRCSPTIHKMSIRADSSVEVQPVTYNFSIKTACSLGPFFTVFSNSI